MSRNRSLALNRVESITSVDIVAQWVRVSWTKRSRGGSAAALRNAVPVAFPLPEIVAPLTHGVVVREWENFEPKSSAQHPTPDKSHVSLRQEDDRLRVALLVYRYGVTEQRLRRRPPTVRLTDGDRLRWQINYRFIRASYGGEWIYQLDSGNVSSSPTPSSSMIVHRTEPGSN